MNAKKLYDVLKKGFWDINVLIAEGILDDVIAYTPAIIIELLNKFPNDICEIDKEVIKNHIDFAVTAIKNGFNDIGCLPNEVLSDPSVEAAIYERLIKERCNIDCEDIPECLFENYKESIRNEIRHANKALCNNLSEEILEKYFLDDLSYGINCYAKGSEICERFTDEFYIRNEEFFFDILCDSTIRYFSKIVLMHYAKRLPSRVLYMQYFYKYSKGSFAVYFSSHEDEVRKALTDYRDRMWFNLQCFDKTGFTKEMFMKLYSYLKEYADGYDDSHKGPFASFNKDNYYYFVISEIFGANYLKGLDYIVDDICLNSDKALREYGHNISNPETILKIIARNPKDIIYLNDMYLEKIEITDDILKTE